MQFASSKAGITSEAKFRELVSMYFTSSVTGMTERNNFEDQWILHDSLGAFPTIS